MPAFSINPDKCTGCDACRVVCPAQAISGVQYKKHKIDPDLCYNCGLCGELCESEAILNGFGAPVKMRQLDDWEWPVVNHEQCIGCSVCIEVCPQFILVLSEAKFHGDTHVYARLTEPENCVGCGKCAKHCPVGAITMVKRIQFAQTEV